jgi:hypothetical protein
MVVPYQGGGEYEMSIFLEDERKFSGNDPFTA